MYSWCPHHRISPQRRGATPPRRESVVWLGDLAARELGLAREELWPRPL